MPPNQYNSYVSVFIYNGDTLIHTMEFSDLQQAYLWVLDRLDSSYGDVPRLDAIADRLHQNVMMLGVRHAKASIYDEQMAYDFYYGRVVI